MPDDPMTPVDRDGPVAEFITEVTTGRPPGDADARPGTGRSLAIGALIGAMVIAGAWVALPGRSGAPSAPIPLPAYGAELPRQELDLAAVQALPDDDLRLVVFGLQPGFSPSDPELLSIGPGGVDEGRLGAEVWWSVRFGEQPGVQRGLATAAAGSMVVTSGGRVVARSADLAGDTVDLGPGISVLPGASADTVWVVTSAGRRVRLVTVPSGMDVVDEPIERGRPLAGGSEGLVLAPQTPGEPFEVWQPHRVGAPVHVLAGSEGGALLGLGGDRVAIAVDDRLLVYEIDPSLGDRPAIEAVTEASFVSDSMVESALSPDGRHLAVGRLTTITEPDVVEIVAVESGEVVTTLRPALGLSFSWIDAGRLAYVAPDGGRFQLVAVPIDGGEATILLESGDLDWFHQFVPIG